MNCMPATMARRLFYLSIPESKYIILTLFFTVIGAICTTLAPILIGAAMDLTSTSVLTESCEVERNEVSNLFFLVLFLEIVNSVATYARERLNNTIGNFVRQRAQVQC